MCSCWGYGQRRRHGFSLSFSNTLNGRIGLFENLGGGLFDTLQTLTEDIASATFVSTADLEGDGDLDVVFGLANQIPVLVG